MPATLTAVRAVIMRKLAIMLLHLDIILKGPLIMVRRPPITPEARNIRAHRPATKKAAFPPVARLPAKTTARSNGGRPSREAAALLRDKILDVATDLFLKNGYEAVSIELIARKARISKRTFYQRFSDKTVVFTNVVHRIVERLRPENDSKLFEGDDLEKILLGLGRVILDAVLTPNALALHRIILAEAPRFPDLAAAVSRQTAGDEAVQRIGALLQHEARAGNISVIDFSFVAGQFLFMIISIPQRQALAAGNLMSAPQREKWVKSTVDLFLTGCRPATR